MTEKKELNTEIPECQFCKSRENRTPIEQIKDKFSEGIQLGSTYFLTGIREINGIIQRKSENWNVLAESGEACIKQYEKMECSDEEHAILLVHNKNPKKNDYIFGSGVDLLVDYFNKKPAKFRIFHCYSPDCFYSSIKKTNAQYLWLFAHGRKHGVSFGKGKENFCPFCKVDRKERKKFIAQLHCCDGEGDTLWQYLSDEPGIYSDGYREMIQNREDIKNWIANDSINSHRKI